VSRDGSFSAAGTAGIEVRSEILQAITAFRLPVIIAHVVPDADALGSMFAIARTWPGPVGTAKVSLPAGSLSQRLAFLFERAQVTVASTEDFDRADGFVVFDTAKKPRCNVGPTLKETDWSANRPLINIDHHATNTRFGTVNWVVEDASSASELAFHLIVAARRKIDSVTASLLYAGIQTDTLGFSLASSRPSALRAAAELIELGADVGELGERLWRSHTQGEFELLRVVYANTRTAAGGRLAYSFLSYEDIQNAGCTAADIDDQISVPRSLSGVQLAILFSEGNRGKTRINFRGSGPVEVVELAANFKGGGHLQAAGAILDCGLHEAIRRVLPAAEEQLLRFAFGFAGDGAT